MTLLRFLRKKIMAPQGIIGFFDLADWWLETFTSEEREFIEDRFQMQNNNALISLTKGKVSFSNERPLRFLSNLAMCSIGYESGATGRKIINKAESYLSATGHPLDIHFFYLSKINIYYGDRDKPEYLEEAILACRNQINIAPKAAKAFKREYRNDPLPSHKGYNQLTLILSESGKHKEVVELCEQAKEQGWGGDWDKRIESSNKVLNK